MKKKVIIISTISILLIGGIISAIIFLSPKSTTETKDNNQNQVIDNTKNNEEQNNISEDNNTIVDNKQEEKQEVKEDTQTSTKSNTKKNNSSNTNSNSNNTNTNNTSNNNQQTQPTSTPEQPKTEEPKPQNLYYGALAPKGTANPTYMLDASDATYNAIAQDSRNVEFMRGQVPDGPGGRSVSIDVLPEPWSKTKDFMNPDGYTYIAYIYISEGDPAWNDTSIQYKGYGSNRIIAEFYWTNKNGSKAWKWNPNGYHF